MKKTILLFGIAIAMFIFAGCKDDGVIDTPQEQVSLEGTCWRCLITDEKHNDFDCDYIDLCFNKESHLGTWDRIIWLSFSDAIFSYKYENSSISIYLYRHTISGDPDYTGSVIDEDTIKLVSCYSGEELIFTKK